MPHTLVICDFVASMRHAGYLSSAAAVLGLAEAHFPGLRNAAARAMAWLVMRLGREGAAVDGGSAPPRSGVAESVTGSKS